MKKHIFIAFTLLSMLLTACENEIEYRGEEQDPLLVLNCIAEAGSSAYVRVSHSIFFLGKTEQVDMSLKDAVVTIEVGDKTEKLTYDAEWDAYVGSIILNEGDQVKVTATHHQYGTVTAEDVVPRRGKLSYTDTIIPFTNNSSASITEDTPGVFEYSRIDSVWKVTFHIDDPVDEANFYRMNVNVSNAGRLKPFEDQWLFQTSEIGDELDDEGYVACNSDLYYLLPTSTQFALGIDNDELNELGIGMSFGSIYYQGSSEFIFTDEYLHSTTNASEIVFDITLHTPIWWGNKEGWYDPDAHYIQVDYDWETGEEILRDCGTPWDHLDNHFIYTVTVSLETITPAYYYYLKSSDKYDSTNWNLFSEPVTVYTNVDGGVGILGITSTPHVISFEREYTFPIPQKK